MFSILFYLHFSYLNIGQLHQPRVEADGGRPVPSHPRRTGGGHR
jgi:hypothetical protein